MRLWSVHPQFLDRQALIAGWREGLLAQSVIGKTSGGYVNHPQLLRFRAAEEPLSAMGAFLMALVEEADARGYRFAREKILVPPTASPVLLDLTEGQLDYEWRHLMSKLEVRNPELALRFADASPLPHPLFRVVPGSVEHWERITR
ncbi:pyrimidine dimer DNA glycosylase/endonuclease V [Salinibacterium sp. SYSU T00001]|uniref:pyrimidine dimer DNA glycosylase/endonuclease V n=1 Tax=Homoserinimonas sedimenticola TaxID=2986805 RepID=UPI002235EEF1|nr:pyrimidine dimer DNA glycosylase/endonuclease V [Salinibacterium sedimenticola]MCW4385695.1 pyrimidine dimer DNA glycosylase/endonuclease V [Salinibacterium sedimenticola]